MAISQRLSKTKPNPTTGLRAAAITPATGLVDTYRQSIEAALALYEPLAPDIYLQMMKGHAADCGNALEDAKNFLWSKRDDFELQYQSASQMQQVALTYIEPDDRPNFFAKLQNEVRDAVISTAGDEPGTLAAACVRNLKNFYDAHRAALDDYEGPRLMSATGRALTIQDLERQAMLKKEVALMAPTTILALYMRFLNRGEEVKLVELETAAQEAAMAFREEIPAVAKERLRGVLGRTVDVDKEKTAAWDLLSAIRGRKARNIPASLKVSEKVLFELRSVFQLVVGVHATLMSPSERSARYYSNADDKNLVGEKNPFEVDPNWLKRRFEQKTPFKLPGYSRPTSRDGDGNWVRNPLPSVPLPIARPDLSLRGRG